MWHSGAIRARFLLAAARLQTEVRSRKAQCAMACCQLSARTLAVLLPHSRQALRRGIWRHPSGGAVKDYAPPREISPVPSQTGWLLFYTNSTSEEDISRNSST